MWWWPIHIIYINHNRYWKYTSALFPVWPLQPYRQTIHLYSHYKSHICNRSRCQQLYELDKIEKKTKRKSLFVFVQNVMGKLQKNEMISGYCTIIGSQRRKNISRRENVFLLINYHTIIPKHCSNLLSYYAGLNQGNGNPLSSNSYAYIMGNAHCHPNKVC